MQMAYSPYSDSAESSEGLQQKPDVLLGCLADLSARQIDAGMSEAAETVGELSTSLLEAAAMVSQLQQNGAGAEAAAQLDQLSNHVMSAFAGLQFVDRLQQRLQNVSGNLGELAGVVGDTMTGQQWGELVQSLRSRYTMESEREMLDEAIAGLGLVNSKQDQDTEQDHTPGETE